MGIAYCPPAIVAPAAMAGPVVAVGKNWIDPFSSGLPSNVTVPEIGWRERPSSEPHPARPTCATTDAKKSQRKSCEMGPHAENLSVCRPTSME